MPRLSTRTIITIVIICVIVAYPIMRIFRVWQLNSRIERFMAQQIIHIQEKNYNDEWFKERNLVKPTEYFLYRSEAYYIDGNLFMKDREGVINSYWISQKNDERKVSQTEWKNKLGNYGDTTLSWSYQIRPVSGSTVCVLITALPPNSWTGPMHSITGVSQWSIDTSKNTWQLTHYDNGTCEFKDKELFRTLLLFVE